MPCGDGPFYVGKLLKKIAVSDKACYSYIQKTREQMWPYNEEKEKAKQMRQNKEREDRRRRAKERQVDSKSFTYRRVVYCNGPNFCFRKN